MLKPLPRVVRAVERFTGQSGYDPRSSTSELTPARGLTVTWKRDRRTVALTVDPVGRNGLRVNLYHADEQDPPYLVWYVDLSTANDAEVCRSLRTELAWITGSKGPGGP